MRELVCALGGCQGWGCCSLPAQLRGVQEGRKAGSRECAPCAGLARVFLNIPFSLGVKRAETAAGLRWELTLLPTWG